MDLGLLVLCVAAALACAPKPYTGAEDDQGPGDAGAEGGTPDAGAADAGPDAGPVCPIANRSCNHLFTYSAAGTTSVNVHGTFTSPAWTVAIPMAEDGGIWSATAPLPWGATVQYDYQVNEASTWIPDPSNPDQVSNNEGGENSELTNISCATWSCGT